MQDIGFSLQIGIDEHRQIVAWMLAAFLVTFLLTRAITTMIRAGRGPFRNASMGGVHVHHQVYGIFLLIGAGTAELTYRPGAPWVQVIAVVFGIGAALTLDEFALWLHLDDVYWAAEGRRSVDAVLIALLVGCLLLIGANPLDDESGQGAAAAAVTISVNLLFAVIAIGKGRTLLGVIGVFIPVLAFIAAVRLARPNSPWARRMYRPGSRRLARSLRRFQPERRTRWDRLVDVFAAPPSLNDRPLP